MGRNNTDDPNLVTELTGNSVNNIGENSDNLDRKDPVAIMESTSNSNGGKSIDKLDPVISTADDPVVDDIAQKENDILAQNKAKIQWVT